MGPIDLLTRRVAISKASHSHRSVVLGEFVTRFYSS